MAEPPERASLAATIKLARRGRERGRADRGREDGFVLDVELEARPGITVLFGPSGSGKSSVLQAVAGLLRPQAGRIALGDQVWFDGARRIDRAVERRQVAYVFQSLALFPHMTAIGNVDYGMPRATPRAERREQARALLDRLGVGHLAARRPRTYSGGEAQRVALARALAMAPQAVLLDEPFSALDRELRLQLATLVRGLVDELRVPLLFVTHNHGEARALGDQVLRMNAGKIVERGTPREILGGAGAFRDDHAEHAEID
jgi:ABC-type sulfate/molybdate transport systems ATPase subunit